MLDYMYGASRGDPGLASCGRILEILVELAWVVF